MKFTIRHRSLGLKITAFSLLMLAVFAAVASGYELIFGSAVFLALSLVVFLIYFIPTVVTVSGGTLRIYSVPLFRKINISDIKGLSIKQTYVTRYAKYRGRYEESRLILEIDVNGDIVTLNGEASTERVSLMNIFAFGEEPDDDPQISVLYEHLKHLTGLEDKNGV